ncbi:MULTISPECIES: DUF7696 family protein [Xanthomonas]|uniref:Regulatory protein RecX n=1 Tax=Xanthomonas campestris pv. glycines TaxID=473421 RepID=A0AAX0HUU7_XANCG|nr:MULTISPECIES: hypothetical protein [Xanthomonas]AOY64064.1 hypothetical protein BHE84_19150 [Xanthomonas citri pv. glycines str. 8ra]ARV22091.1 hypothetical protein A9D66_05610 [Xanthomonas citri pv. glycines str. 12-2]EWC51443.1 hypothetical protein XAR_2429 [Xanthomonas citri pv. glycines str. 8ra]OEY88187.1 hypothetical protein BIY41_05600 [Xanthomonas citri pv. glycines]OOX02044.1 hypothetical protein Xgly_16925 [Xanthomonas citri pv. glycines]
MIDGANVEGFRRACEARHWLRQGYTDAAKVQELRLRIAAQRGYAAADLLVVEMREQWRHRREWIEGRGA